jgi:hypothetical protein
LSAAAPPEFGAAAAKDCEHSGVGGVGRVDRNVHLRVLILRATGQRLVFGIGLDVGPGRAVGAVGGLGERAVSVLAPDCDYRVGIVAGLDRRSLGVFRRAVVGRVADDAGGRRVRDRRVDIRVRRVNVVGPIVLDPRPGATLQTNPMFVVMTAVSSVAFVPSIASLFLSGLVSLLLAVLPSGLVPLTSIVAGMVIVAGSVMCSMPTAVSAAVTTTVPTSPCEQFLGVRRFGMQRNVAALGQRRADKTSDGGLNKRSSSLRRERGGSKVIV